MAVLIVLGLYLLACYAYGVVLLARLLRTRRRAALRGEGPGLPHTYPGAAAAPRKAAA